MRCRLAGIQNRERSDRARKSDELFYKNRSVYLWGGVDDNSAKDVVNRLLLLDADKPGEEIKFYINSPGGSFTALTAIYDTMMYVRPEIQTICMGQAASAAKKLIQSIKVVGLVGNSSIIACTVNHKYYEQQVMVKVAK